MASVGETIAPRTNPTRQSNPSRMPRARDGDAGHREGDEPDGERSDADQVEGEFPPGRRPGDALEQGRGGTT